MKNKRYKYIDKPRHVLIKYDILNATFNTF